MSACICVPACSCACEIGSPTSVLCTVQADVNGLGRITFDELEFMIRQAEGRGMALSRSRLPDARLKRLWRALDDAEHGYVEAGAWGRFMRFGAAFPYAGGQAGCGGLQQGASGSEKSLPPPATRHGGGSVTQRPTCTRTPASTGVSAAAQRAAELRQERTLAIERETAERLAVAAREKEHAVRQAQIEADRLEAELAALGDVQPYVPPGHVDSRLEERLTCGYALARAEIDELRAAVATESAAGERLARRARAQRQRSSFS